MRPSLGPVVSASMAILLLLPSSPPSPPVSATPDFLEIASDSLGEAKAVDNSIDGIAIETGDATVKIPKDASKGISVESPLVDFHIAIPRSEDARFAGTEGNYVVFDNGDGSSTAVSSHSDESLTIISIIEGESAPDRFTYSYSGLGQLRQDPTDGGVTIWQQGQQVGYFLSPWAFDAAGREVPTWYEVHGSKLTQVVDHSMGGWTYPITADPTQNMGGNSFYSNITLDINMTTAAVIVRVTPAPGHVWVRMPRSTGIPPYNALVPSTYEARKYHDQLVCHWSSAGYLKTPWNLDSWRPDVGYLATVFAACNP